MFLQLLLESPILAFVWVIVILISLTIHEFFHAWAGSLKGDRTAEAMGRLTLNPLAHIDPMGFIPLLLFGFGWAKPVPFNPYNLKNPKNDAVFIALAGPFANLIMATLAGIGLRIMFLTGVALGSLLEPFLALLVIINLFLFFFNLIPVAPLDGSKLVDALLTAPKYTKTRIAIATYGPRILLGLIIFSFFVPYNVFFFVSVPAYVTCDLLTGQSCVQLLATVL